MDDERCLYDARMPPDQMKAVVACLQTVHCAVCGGAHDAADAGLHRRGVEICLDTEYKVKAGQYNEDGALETAVLALLGLRG